MSAPQHQGSTTPQYEAKHPVTVLAGPYGHPFHPLLVTVPIGAWTASLVFDIASRFVKHPAFLVLGARWLIAVGVLGALAAACAGFLDMFAIPPHTRAYRTAVLHMALNLVVTGAYAAGFGWRYYGHQHAGPVPAAQAALSAASLLVLGFSGYLGGKMSFRYGVRVADEATQAEGFTDGDASPSPSWPAQASRI
jgi:uncharacterized membrane protein